MLRALRLNPRRNPSYSAEDYLSDAEAAIKHGRDFYRLHWGQPVPVTAQQIAKALADWQNAHPDNDHTLPGYIVSEIRRKITPPFKMAELINVVDLKVNRRRNPSDFDPLAYARQCVEDAITLQAEHGSLMDALQSFRKGQLVDTLRENGITDRATLEAADREFSRELSRRLGVLA